TTYFTLLPPAVLYTLAMKPVRGLSPRPATDPYATPSSATTTGTHFLRRTMSRVPRNRQQQPCLASRRFGPSRFALLTLSRCLLDLFINGPIQLLRRRGADPPFADDALVVNKVQRRKPDDIPCGRDRRLIAPLVSKGPPGDLMFGQGVLQRILVRI